VRLGPKELRLEESGVEGLVPSFVEGSEESLFSIFTVGRDFLPALYNLSL